MNGNNENEPVKSIDGTTPGNGGSVPNIDGSAPDASKHDEMKEHFKTIADSGQFDTKNIKFNWDELQNVMKDRIAKGEHSFTVTFAAYQTPEHAKDYAEKHGVDAADVVGKVTLLVNNDDGTHSEIAKICPPPPNCGD